MGRRTAKNLGDYAKKGNVPWNKGLKGFMAGNKHYNWKGGISTNKRCPICEKKILSTSQTCWKCYLKTRSTESLRKGGLNSRKILNLRNETSIEKKLYEALKSKGLLFEKQYLIGGRFLVDAYVPSLNLIIEADGKYWHELEHIKIKDTTENMYLKQNGYNLLRLSEKEINDGSFMNKIN